MWVGGQQKRMSMVEPARNLQWPSGCFDLSLSFTQPLKHDVPKNVFITHWVRSHSIATAKIIGPIPKGPRLQQRHNTELDVLTHRRRTVVKKHNLKLN